MATFKEKVTQHSIVSRVLQVTDASALNSKDDSHAYKRTDVRQKPITVEVWHSHFIHLKLFIVHKFYMALATANHFKKMKLTIDVIFFQV